MRTSTTRSRFPEILIALLLLASMVFAGLAIHAGERRAQSWGPRALALAPDGNIWLINDRQLLIVAADGTLKRQVDLAQMGLPGPVNSLAPLPNGGDGTRMLAGVIDSPEWLVLDGEGRVADHFRPQGVGDAIHHTFHLGTAADGRIAMATSGDHRVLLFDQKGQRLAESPAGLFRYANGIWHEDDSWWVVDTNHGKVQKLNGQSLASEGSIRVPSVGSARFPALARRSPAGAITLTEMHNDMTRGVLIDVSPDGTLLREYRSRAEDPEPVDFLWLGNELLLIDRDDYSLQLFDAEGSFLRNWGGAELNEVVRASHAERLHWSNILLGGQIGAAVLGLFALLGYAWWKQRRMPAGRAEAALSTLATPSLAGKEELLSQIRLFWPLGVAMLLLVGVMEVVKRMTAPLAGFLKPAIEPQWTIIMFALVAPLVILTPIMLLLVRWLGERTRLPEHEAMLSTRWVRWFQRSSTAQEALDDNEAAREILMVQTSMLFPAFNMNVWLLTDRRLLIFRPGPGNDGKLLAAVNRRDCSATIEPATGWRRFLGGRDTIRVATRDGLSYSGYAGSPVTAARIATLLGNVRHLSTAWSRTSTAPEMRSPEPATAFVLSLLAPGSVHLMQDRFPLGILLLTIAALLAVLLVGPVLLGWIGQYYDVPTSTGVVSLSMFAAWALMAASDAAHYARKAHRQS